MINWDRVEELHEEIGPEDFDSVVALFLEEVGQAIGRLEENSSRSNLGADLHFLKGCALNLGFNSFSLVCQTGETLVSEGNEELVNLPGLLATYEDSLNEFQLELETRLKQLKRSIPKPSSIG
ncbi:Hpt domain-containing protein [Shimia sp. CNT1-13L.2]|uniref:Hpt domain-containing protein n=1 Tax=Shimia sp. CNT1-13L.2 TaxID=2959663 RepID=UPI0020CF8C81|nr:Hpt domain-containing protein [Shimia sp. CNT1-13L.2]MCP9482596.1 Hpt domain-containing protein [Shimia sp. CNT1-13L.2]